MWQALYDAPHTDSTGDRFVETKLWAADFFLVVHDEFKGRLRINRDLLGCGLVTAQIGQLVAGGTLGVTSGRVVAVEGAPPPTDEIDEYVVESVRGQASSHTVRTWIDTLDEVLYELMARRLVESGVVRRESGSGLLRRRPDRFPSVDLLSAARPRLRLESMLRRPREFDLAGAFTAALIWACGVDVVLDPELDRTAARELTDEIGERLPPELGELLAGTRAAVAAISLTVRR